MIAAVGEEQFSVKSGWIELGKAAAQVLVAANDTRKKASDARKHPTSQWEETTKFSQSRNDDGDFATPKGIRLIKTTRTGEA